MLPRTIKNRFINTTLRRKILLLTTLLVTVTPILLISILGATYYKLGVERLFNSEIQRALDETVEVSEFYLNENKHNMEIDIIALREIIHNNEYLFFRKSKKDLQIFLDEEAKRRKLDEIVIFTPGKIIAKNTMAISFSFLQLPFNELSAISNYSHILPFDSLSLDSKIRIVMAYDLNSATYILVGKHLETDIINHVQATQESYSELINSIQHTQLQLKVIFLGIAMILIAISIYLSRKLALFISAPINRLVEATEHIKRGDYSVMIPEKPGKDETAILSRAFNNMTATLSRQRQELVEANIEIDERRRFIEQILSEIPSGVLILSPKGFLIQSNNVANKILQINENHYKKSLKSFFPEMGELFSKASSTGDLSISGTVEISRNKLWNLEIKISKLINRNNKVDNFIITANDISELVSAQRSSAWGDVARRIAHEIKNPLTPITLSLERLNKKYSPQITNDRENFDRYISTISNHVGTIWRIVEDFVNFARIPAPRIENCNICNLINEVTFAQRNVYKNVEYSIDLVSPELYTRVDPIQITQVLTNLLKNSAESIEIRQETANDSYQGKIHLSLTEAGTDYVSISITDNGTGISEQVLDRIFEPYVTNKSKGTGLGLAIVKKIIEDHGGTLNVTNIEGGAKAVFTLLKSKGD